MKAKKDGKLAPARKAKERCRRPQPVRLPGLCVVSRQPGPERSGDLGESSSYAGRRRPGRWKTTQVQALNLCASRGSMADGDPFALAPDRRGDVRHEMRAYPRLSLVPDACDRRAWPAWEPWPVRPRSRLPEKGRSKLLSLPFSDSLAGEIARQCDWRHAAK